MSLGNASALFFGGQPSGGGATGYQIERSVRINAADTAYLSRTLPTSGNTQKFTWSGWVKRGLDAGGRALIAAGTSSPNRQSYFSINTDIIRLLHYDGATQCDLVTTAIFRDFSAWMHIVLSVDTTQATSTDRVKIYVNGVQLTSFITATYPPLNQGFYINNSSYLQSIGDMAGYAPGTYPYDGYLADIHFVDGQALSPTSFGEFSSISGVWSPIEFTGTYGTTGFHLDFADNSSAAALGTDTSGNNNNWTVNNISVVSGYNYSALFDGTNDSASVADNSALRLGTGDFTLEFWIRFNALTGYQTVFDKGYNGTGGILLQTSLNSGNFAVFLNGSTLFTTSGTPVTNTWYHFALVRSGNTVTAYRNGTSVGSGTSSADFNDTSTLYFGGSPGGGGYYLNGYISNLRIVKGTAVYTSSFTPPTAPLTAITNTSLLTAQSSTFKDNSANAFTVTANNGALISAVNPFSAANPQDNDSLVDSPTNGDQTDTGAGGVVVGNYCVWNRIDKWTAVSLANGNLDISQTDAGFVKGTFAVSTGKWYWEVLKTDTANQCTGISLTTVNPSATYVGGVAGTAGINQASGAVFVTTPFSRVNATDVGAIANGSIIGCALDCDNGTFKLYVNGTLLTANHITFTPGLLLTPAIGTNVAAGAYPTNFGQRPFAYPVSGFKSLCTANLTSTITKSSTVMDVKLYTGNGSTQTISGLGFSPDFVWIKQRSSTEWHGLFDSVRGVLKPLFSNATEAEGSGSGVSAFNSGGFALTDNAYVNGNSSTYVAWTWDAGSSTVTNNDGTVSSQVRANPSAGFSVVTGTAPASGTFTYGHGLGIKPSFIIFKDRDNAVGWVVHHSSVCTTSSEYLSISSTGALSTATNVFGSALPTSSVVGALAGTTVTASAKFVAYCFAPVAGYSAFGSYTGNGSTNGPFVYTGFRPRWLMIKQTSSAGTNWVLHDSQRDPYNEATKQLLPSSANAETDTGAGVTGSDFLSNGFKLRGTNAATNSNTATYIYVAFAESPLFLARAR